MTSVLHQRVVFGTLAVWVVDNIRPLDGPVSWKMSTAWRSSGMVPTRVPSSKNQVLRSREGTLSWIFMVRGLKTRLNPRLARGSPWWNPVLLQMLVEPKMSREGAP